MAGQHEPVTDRTTTEAPPATQAPEPPVHRGTAGKKAAPKTRRRSQPWDRLKILVLIGVVLAIILSAKVNAPFTTFSEALSETWNETFGRFLMVAFVLEVVRQVHYWVAERSARYNTLWHEGFFGGIERQTHKRLNPWTRFRLGRYIRVLIYLLVVGAVIDYFVDSVNGPIEALIQGPRILARNLQQFIFFLFAPLYLIIQFGALFWFLSRGGVDTVMPEEIKTRYDDVWGQDHVLELVRENVGFLEKPDEIEAKGGYIPGGILLWGPPGTGKTLIAEATAGEVGVPFVFVEPGAFIQMFFGVGILKVKGLFRKLRKLSLRHGGVVVFFDEADSLGSRGALAQGGPPGQPAIPLPTAGMCNGASFLTGQTVDLLIDEAGGLPDDPEPQGRWINRVIMGGGMGGGGMGTLQALLTEISGLTKPRGISNKIRKTLGMRPKPPPKYRIFIMMASNMPQSLDPALLRPGRIDRIYKVGYPATSGRKETIRGYLDKVDNNLTEGQLDELATKTPYYSGAKIKDLVNEALIHAMRDDRVVVTWDDIWHAKRLKELGPSEGFQYVDREEFAVAIHEAGHAVAAHLLRPRLAIDIATIERRGDIGGMVKSIPMEDRFTSWKSELEIDVKVSLASLAAERMFFDGDSSMGVGGDLQSATTVVSRMVGVYGMGDTIASAAGMPRHLLDQPPDPTDQIKRHQSAQVETKLHELYDDVYSLLAQHRESLLAIALRLQDIKTMSGTEIAEIMGTEVGSVSIANPGGFAGIDLDVVRHVPGRKPDLDAVDDLGPNATAAESAEPDPAESDTTGANHDEIEPDQP